MTVTALLCYTLACWGLSFTLAYTKISFPFRNALSWWAGAEQIHLAGDWRVMPAIIRWAAKWLLALVECVACTGFWIGIATGAVGLHLGEIGSALAVPILGFYSLGTNAIIGRALRLID